MRDKSFNLFGILIIVAAIFTWLITAYKTEPFLLNQYQQIGFNIGFDFFQPFLGYPGGISDYIADFIAQFFFFNLIGSLLIVLVSALQGFLALNIVRRIKGKTKLDFLFFSAFLIIGVVVLCDYRYPYYASIRLLFALVFTWLFVVLKERLKKNQIIIWVILTLTEFYVASGISLIVFALSTSLIAIFTRKNRNWLIQVPLYLVIGLLIPFVSYKFVFPTTLLNLYRITEVKPPEMLAYSTLSQLYGYYSLLPIILISLFFLKGDSANLKEKAGSKLQSQKGGNLFEKSWFQLSLQFILVIGIGTFLYVKSYDSFRKKLIYIEYYSQEGKWKELLELAETINSYDFRVNYQVNRAYAHLGQLPDKLFNYPQVLGVNGLFFDSSSMNGSFTMPISDLYYDLGFMSESQRWAYEAQTLLPYSPRILKRIIMIHLINEKYDLAEEFLNVLNKNLLYRKWVRKIKKYVTNPELVSNDPEIIEKRKFTPRADKVNFNPYENLKLLLETNRNNRMAYDYLLTLCILDLNYQGFVEFAKYYSYYDIQTMPQAWAEMLTYYIIKFKEVPSFVSNQTVSRKYVEDMRTFNNVIAKYNGNMETAQGALKRDFGDTFWYYLIYLNPRVTNVLNNKTEFK